MRRRFSLSTKKPEGADNRSPGRARVMQSCIKKESKAGIIIILTHAISMCLQNSAQKFTHKMPSKPKLQYPVEIILINSINNNHETNSHKN